MFVSIVDKLQNILTVHDKPKGIITPCAFSLGSNWRATTFSSLGYLENFQLITLLQL